ncbi:type IV inositol polyphosphate 5-phosphatase 9 [Tripterygium wilfordii]|nr:type IV inositol polyphosphate 5-phosphatase 9 [Tripterygium wilfordii]
MWPRLVANKILRKGLGSNNFFADFPKNNSQPDLLGVPSRSHSSDRVLNNHHKDVETYEVFVSTWNVGGVTPNGDLNMEDWLDACNTLCDIYVLGFQEIVPLRASNVLGSEKSEISRKWNSLIREALNKRKCYKEEDMQVESGPTASLNDQEFVCIVSKQMVGILITVWVRSKVRPYVRHPSVSCVGCGIMGCLGNKGSVSVRFRLHETSFCFVCSHLASGGKEGDEKHRNSNVSEILSRTHFLRSPSLDLPRKILDHDRVVLLGDLNYRVSLPEATIRLLVHRGDWSTLLENDQLRMELMEGRVFEGWHEGTIQFPPTYKYWPDSDVYFGFTQKWRAPAWCDRIIWYGEGLKKYLYTRGESNLSDHRPVKAIFTAEVGVLRTLKGIQSLFLSNRFERFTHQLSLNKEVNLYDGKSSFKF